MANLFTNIIYNRETGTTNSSVPIVDEHFRVDFVVVTGGKFPAGYYYYCFYIKINGWLFLCPPQDAECSLHCGSSEKCPPGS